MKKKKITEALRELEEIISQLETSQISVEDAFELFKRGVTLYKDVQNTLKNLEVAVRDVYAELREEDVENDQS
ncbi:MAG: exodeoxyribonuclease VII small subunit [Thermotogae bacterium]|nr:MAG: exodeoxyribonuclease VII small subunit [Thermotogota bacterium]